MRDFPPPDRSEAAEAHHARSERACGSLLDRSALTQDSGDGEGFADLLTEDAVWKRPGRPPIAGRADILRHARALFADHAAGTRIAHFMTNFDFSVAGATATSRCYAFAHTQGTATGDGTSKSLVYLDECAQEYLIWKIKIHEEIYMVGV